jgi:hypothetical protein
LPCSWAGCIANLILLCIGPVQPLIQTKVTLYFT